MKVTKELQSRIETTINKAVSKYTGDCKRMEITDIHIQPRQSTGELLIFDDEDRKLASAPVKEWTTCEGTNFYENIGRVLRTILNKMKESGSFQNINILAPYSFVLIDEDKETISELMLMDEDIMLLNEELLEGLDQELNDFLKDLLEN